MLLRYVDSLPDAGCVCVCIRVAGGGVVVVAELLVKG